MNRELILKQVYRAECPLCYEAFAIPIEVADVNVEVMTKSSTTRTCYAIDTDLNVLHHCIYRDKNPWNQRHLRGSSY